MSGAAYWLPVIWTVILAAAILIYVILDGFDLGIGMLFAVERDRGRRDVMVNTVAPVWDGNETWMILGGATLYGVFPGAYSTLLPALYLPILLMVLALIFRGVAFEFRIMTRDSGRSALWDLAFFGGSAIAAFCQGAILGGIIQGVSVTKGAFNGGPLDWLTPFSILCGLSVMCGYALLGACWLVWRTTGVLEASCRFWARRLAIGLFLGIIAVSLWTPMLHEPYLVRWTDWPNIVFVAPVPLLVMLLGFLFVRGLQREHPVTPFLCALGWFFLCFTGLGISIFPYMVPPSLTLWDVSSPPSSQAFQLVGTAILLPIILTYTIYSYRVFRGKVTEADAYH
ncbi:cytochrome bd ubiquinol oxidase subunit II [Acetobacter aceti NRIC 0242]|uniref:Cyanide insensitive terminal oxidase subunit II n=1 Tax=Acetobacter aceti NBRC 14818 TaxID=887700 RepID=A0AB33IL06_ACEAC|nr:cytochrome d ubiquinol oxidase subunit II [Acetobacter aceti]TCS31045.1 cytochrome bd-I ubiquinol oxidase subunit 2 apoprotein [Acetobacter aceti NBRC 14818]BCK76587.1 cyanide insensitive terminal oxidase subunit II [Acetobacter aceti NBRC 14818]GAN58578.1 cytochrome bd ubiquinol oxidase subunit II [Acetobacter aceti NBRC 14818]GBO81533.1 cytochrome bd ubiquinol oxidase subunit II [Acetobacter aceti NRIC 0242]